MNRYGRLGKKKGFSLSLGLTGLVAGCWLMPIILIIASLSYYTTTRTRQQIDHSIQRAVASAAYNSRQELESLVAASRKASTDGLVYQAYQTYKNNLDRVTLYDRLTYYLSRQYRYNDNLISTILFLVDEPEQLYVMHNPAAGTFHSRLQEYQNTVHNKLVQLSQTLDTRILIYSSDSNTYMVRNMVDKNYEPYAVIVMLLDDSQIFQGFENITGSTGVNIYLNGTPLLIREPDKHSVLESFEVPAYTDIGRGELLSADFGDSTILYGRESMDAVHMLYAVEIDRQFFSQHLSDLHGIIALLILLMVPLSLFTVWFLYRNILSPIKGLVAASQTIQQGNLGYQFEEAVGNNEFVYLIEAFNGMSEQLKEQFEHIYNEELALRDARIMALQSQINPHFLNNTLEIINWETRMGQNAKVSRMIESLSTMLDAAMNRKSAPLVPLSQEIMYVDAYLYIISERFGKRLIVHKEIDESLLHNKIPRLIMQPLIENAVEHGMTPQQTTTIVIRARQDGQCMRMEVENNMPMSPKDKEQVEKLLSPVYDAKSEGSLHLGIRNVNMRLRMIYGDEHALSVTSGERSTTASFSVPT